MKCLSLNQPYADLLASGKKKIEVRKWNTKFRGEFLIHAAKTINLMACNILNIDSALCIRGSIIGKCYLYDVKIYLSNKDLIRDFKMNFVVDEKKFDDKRKRMYGFLIRDAIRFNKAIPYKGKLGFFNVDI